MTLRDLVIGRVREYEARLHDAQEMFDDLSRGKTRHFDQDDEFGWIDVTGERIHELQERAFWLAYSLKEAISDLNLA